MKWHNIIKTTVYFLRQTHLTDSYINDESVPRKQRDQVLYVYIEIRS